MFNINLLGPPGIQPDIVNSYISYHPEDEKNVKNVIVNEEPGFFTKIINYVPSKSDYVSFVMLCFIVTFIIYLKPENRKSIATKDVYNVLSLDSIDLNENYLVLKNFFKSIQNNENIKLLKIASENSLMNFKFSSNKGFKELNKFSRDFKVKYGIHSRIHSDKNSNFILSVGIPWKVYNDPGEISKIQNFGKSSYILFIIEDLIKHKKLHKGKLNVDIKEEDNYFIKFYPVQYNI